VETPSGSAKRPAILVIGVIAILLLACLFLASAVLNNPVTAVPQAAIALLAAFSLWRGNAWAGFGLALFLVSSTAAAVFAAWRIDKVFTPNHLVAAIIPLTIAALAFLAGQALPRRATQAVPWILVAAIPVTLALFFNLMILPTASMEPTLLSGDSLLIRRTGANAVARGDLVVYHEPINKSIFVKRVVGLEGDRIHFERKMLFVTSKILR